MYHFIVNPVSRSGKGLRLWQKKIEPILISRGIEYSVEFSKERGDVTRICSTVSSKSRDEENCVIVILGGDGTLHDAVQGIENFDATVLGYIPTGSSNDFARDMKISSNVKKTLLRILDSKNEKQIDIGEVRADSKKYRFAVSAGLGFDAAVCQRACHSIVKKRLNKIGLGKLTYLAIAVNQIINAPYVDAKISFDGGESVELRKFLFSAFMVHRYEGGGFMFCPKADCADGIMDVCSVNSKGTLGVLTALPTALFGMHGKIKGISVGRFNSVELEASIPLWLHTDGEVYQKASKISARTFEKKLRIIF